MSKTYEEGGDLMSSERLAPAFLTLGIAETSEHHEAENEPLTYKAALQSPQARQRKEAMHQEWQALVENHTFDIVAQGNTAQMQIADVLVEEPIG